MYSCGQTFHKNIYNKQAIEDLCLQESKFPKNKTCTYNTYEYCKFTLTNPAGVIRPFDLNHFVLDCNNGSSNSIDSHLQLRYTTREKCICIAFGKYIGYFNEKCPWLECLCFPSQGDPLSDNISESTNNSKKCKGLHRRNCKIYYYDKKKIVGTCKTKKQPFKFEQIIECPNNNSLENIKRTNDESIIEQMKGLLAPSYLKKFFFFASPENINSATHNSFSSVSGISPCYTCEIFTQDLTILTFIITLFYLIFMFIFFMSGSNKTRMGYKISKPNNDCSKLANEEIANPSKEANDLEE